jgi:hypothetical protein
VWSKHVINDVSSRIFFSYDRAIFAFPRVATRFQ